MTEQRAPTMRVNVEAVPDVRRLAEILRVLSRTAYEVHTTLQDAATDLDLIGSDDEPGEQPAEPVCRAQHCLTRDGRLWTHGPRRARCRGSQRTLPGARWAARTGRTFRGIETVYLPGDGPTTARRA